MPTTNTPGSNANKFQQVAPALHGRGYHVIPCNGKRPAVEDWRNWRLTSDIEAFKDCNTGIVLGENGLVALDIDVLDEETANELQRVAQANIFTGVAPVRVGKRPKQLLLFRVSGPPQRKRKQNYVSGAIELLGEGQQFVAFGTHPETHRPYEWFNSITTSGIGKYSPLSLDIADLPVIDPERLDLMWQALQDTMYAAGFKPKGSESPSTKTHTEPAKEGIYIYLPKAPQSVIEAIRKLDPDDYDTWISVGQALKSEEIRSGEMWPHELWCLWSSHSPKWDAEVGSEKWRSFDQPRASLDNISHWTGGSGFPELAFKDIPAEPEAARPGPKSLKQLREEQKERKEFKKFMRSVLRPMDYSSILSEEISEASFCLPDILPDNVVTLFSAHGGTGKSYIALMVAVAVAAGLKVLNREPDSRRVLYYTCEEPENVIKLRLKRICRYFGVNPADLHASGRLVIHNGFGESNVMFTGSREVEQRLTETYKGLLAAVEQDRFGLIILDNSSEMYDASEIDRALVRQFIQSLNTFAKLTHGAVMLIAHVDKATTTGQNVTGYSGSTAWHNSVRSRWFLSSKGDGLLLQFQKSNYSALANDLMLRWLDSEKVFEVESEIQKEKEVIVNNDEAIVKVASALAAFEAEGVVVPDTSTSTGNGVALLAERTGLDRKVVKDTLIRMHGRKMIERVDYQKTNRKTGTAIVLTDEGRRGVVQVDAGDDDQEMLG